MGDLNCNMASAHFDSNTRLLCEISDIYGLQQLITEPTRITESSSSLIDVIFTNCINRVVCSRVLHIGISDHSLIYVYRKLSPEFAFKGHSTKTYRNFSNFNRENFRRDISRQDWSCTSDDPNVLWADWKAKFLSIVNSHAPLKTKRVGSGKVPWITSDLWKGKLLSLTILKTGLCTKGYVIGSMEKSNLQRHPIMLVRLFSLLAIHVKPGN